MNIPKLRLISQHLENPQLNTPHELLSYLGAMQAQNYPMSKWAIAIRLKNSVLDDIETALAQGEILRIHVMRPTWHLLAAENIRWMCELSKASIKTAAAHGDVYLEIDEKLFTRVNNLLETFLRDNNHLTRMEIANCLNNSGIKTNSSRMVHFMLRAEAEGIVCSGIDKGKNQTYALIEERALPARKLSKDEALATLAKNYFQSHSPATLYDFAWWSGLSLTNSKLAVNLIENELITEQFDNQSYYIHKSLNSNLQGIESLHLLPSFDEYIIAYKDRTAVIAPEHQPKAFTKNGIFFPVVLHNGKVVGVWDKTQKKNDITFNYEYCEQDFSPKKSLLKGAEKKYLNFVNLPKNTIKQAI